MKKFYTLSLALAVAMTASASQHHTAAVSSISVDGKAHPAALTTLVNKLKAADITAPAKAMAAEVDESWSNVGTATLVDGWLTPAFGDDQFNLAYEVELERNDSNPNKYRVVNPYKGNFSLAFLNSAEHDGYIQFDLSDPDHVTFDIVEAGLMIPNMSSFAEFYCYNTLSYLCHHFELPAAQIVDVLGDECPYTTYRDNIVELGYVELPDEDGNLVKTYDACFGTKDDPYSGSGWDDTTLDMRAQIILPENITNGIGNLAPASENGPARYFNLQGVEVSEPATGSVVIRLQNGKAVKTVVR